MHGGSMHGCYDQGIKGKKEGGRERGRERERGSERGRRGGQGEWADTMLEEEIMNPPPSVYKVLAPHHIILVSTLIYLSLSVE
jgi:hypothetical protein